MNTVKADVTAILDMEREFGYRVNIKMCSAEVDCIPLHFPPPGIHYLGQLHENSLLKVALDQITDGQLQFTRLEQHFDTLLLGQPDQRR